MSFYRLWRAEQSITGMLLFLGNHQKGVFLPAGVTDYGDLSKAHGICFCGHSVSVPKGCNNGAGAEVGTRSCIHWFVLHVTVT